MLQPLHSIPCKLDDLIDVWLVRPIARPVPLAFSEVSAVNVLQLLSLVENCWPLTHSNQREQKKRQRQDRQSVGRRKPEFANRFVAIRF